MEVLGGEMAALKFLLLRLVPTQIKPIFRLSSYSDGHFLIARGREQTQESVLSLIISLRRGPGDPYGSR